MSINNVERRHYSFANLRKTDSVALPSSNDRLAITVLATVIHLSTAYFRVPASVIQENLGVGVGTGIELASIEPVPTTEPVIIRVPIANFTWSPTKQPTN